MCHGREHDMVHGRATEASQIGVSLENVVSACFCYPIDWTFQSVSMFCGWFATQLSALVCIRKAKQYTTMQASLIRQTQCSDDRCARICRSRAETSKDKFWDPFFISYCGKFSFQLIARPKSSTETPSQWLSLSNYLKDGQDPDGIRPAPSAQLPCGTWAFCSC